MKAALNGDIIVNNYFALLKRLSPRKRMDLISKLAQSLKGDLKPEKNLFESSFGAWQGNESAEEIIAGCKAYK